MSSSIKNEIQEEFQSIGPMLTYSWLFAMLLELSIASWFIWQIILMNL